MQRAVVMDSQRTRRLLVISYHFPPDGSVGGLRWSGLSKYLARQGWEVHVLTAAQQSGPAANGVFVHTCLRARTLNDAYNRVASRLRRAAPDAPTRAPASGATPAETDRLGLASLVRRELSASLVFPDFARGWILRAARQARRLLRRHRFDAVVTSGPPHSAHLVGLLATRGRHEPLFVDMRDPWADLMVKGWGKNLYGSALSRALIPRLEQRVFRSARRIITNTEEFASALHESLPDLRVSHLSNGIDPERLPEPAPSLFAGLSIAYVGTLYAGRNLRPVLLAMRRFLDTHPDAAAAGLRLRFAGTMAGRHEAQFHEQLEEAGVRDRVEVLGLVPPAEALSLLNRSHLSIVLAQDQQLQIPAKLYESVGMGLPTLVIAEPTSAAAREAVRIGGITRSADDVDGICELLRQLWTGALPTRTTPRAPIDYAQLAAEMSTILGGAARDARPSPVEEAAALARS